MYEEIDPYFIDTSEDGKIPNDGNETSNNLQLMFSSISRFFEEKDKNNQPKKILLYCHGGLVSQTKGMDLTKHHYQKMLENHIYPVYFLWESDLLNTLKAMFHTIHTELENHDLVDQMKQKIQVDRTSPYTDQKKIEDILKEVHQSMTDQPKSNDSHLAPSLLHEFGDFVESLAGKIKNEVKVISGELDDTYDKIIQYIAKHFSILGKHIPDVWAQMKETAKKIFQNGGGGDIFITELLNYFDPGSMEIHIVGHSAGSIVLSTLLNRLNEKDPKLQGLKIKSCTLMAAACTETLFNEVYLPAIQNQIIENFFLYTLNDELERDDTCWEIFYRKSLLYAISECLEPTLEPEKIIGMEIYAEKNEFINRLKDSKQMYKWIISNGCRPADPMKVEFIGSEGSFELISKDKNHGGFSQDIYTMNSVIKSIVGYDNIVPFIPDDEFFSDPCK
ncbi:hypothetical protein HPT25_20730 [Bacillus sp. BRMEA1]|uniref:hypothetical protein n=1 Tax=Neobacillus endophyticus TaxID=2738405 RepID=UPI0015644405|nr:hypothetical protein [Neobacillus endophyticus]NRD79766.1 hypothetical protein [Neobacillus endophyticus]